MSRLLRDLAAMQCRLHNEGNLFAEDSSDIKEAIDAIKMSNERIAELEKDIEGIERFRRLRHNEEMQRYEQGDCDGDSGRCTGTLEEDPDGEWVLYETASERIAELEDTLARAKTKAARWDALMGEGRVHIWNRIPPQYGMERAWTTIHTGAFVQSVYDSPEALADALIEEEG